MADALDVTYAWLTTQTREHMALREEVDKVLFERNVALDENESIAQMLADSRDAKVGIDRNSVLSNLHLLDKLASDMAEGRVEKTEINPDAPLPTGAVGDDGLIVNW